MHSFCLPLMSWARYTGKRALLNILSLVLIPALILYPQADILAQTHPIQQQSDIDELAYDYTYDDVLDLLDELEEGGLEERLSPEGLARLNHFLSFLAWEGLLPGVTSEEADIERDIKKLLEPEAFSSFSRDDSGHLIIPAISYGNGDIILCKSWAKKKWEQTKKFVKKHKKAIIIGAAVIVATTVVVCAIVAASSAATIAAASAAGAAAVIENEDRNTPQSGPRGTETHIPSSAQNIEAVIHDPVVKETLNEHIASFKETIGEEEFTSSLNPYSEKNFAEKARDVASLMAHEALECIEAATVWIPAIVNKEGNAFKAMMPTELKGSLLLDSSENITETHHNFFTSGHERVDEFFSTEFSDFYTSGASTNRLSGFHHAVLPPLGSSSTGIGNSGKIAPTLANNVRGWKVGQKINNRTLFGTVPRWSTVRRRYWKNQAHLCSEKYKPKDLERMRNGLAPQQYNEKLGIWESKELHHIPSQKDGGLFDFIELWPEEHARLDPNRCLGR